MALQTRDAVPHDELAGLLRESYEMILAKLPKKMQEAIASGKHSGRVARAKAGRKTGLGNRKVAGKMGPGKKKKTRR